VTFTTLIEAHVLKQLLVDARTGIAVLDCRFDLQNPSAGHSAYLAGHIPGARYADLNKDLSAPVTLNSGRHPLPTPQEFAATLDRLGIGNDAQVVAYDDSSGSFAARGWWMLRWVGHQAVAILDGGLRAWTQAGGALESGEPLPASASASASAPANLRRFLPRVDTAAVIGAAQVAAQSIDPAHLLVDARAPERFTGAVEPIDAVAGHIAGAVNHPFTANLTQHGRFLPVPELRRRWKERLGGKDPRNVAAMCGSGVTACHNLLALEVAGLHGAKLYAGSWSEWIKDPSRAVARGA
jgi:thiosulfate/3-mercaptopyruvate sulfurtransferase